MRDKNAGCFFWPLANLRDKAVDGGVLSTGPFPAVFGRASLKLVVVAADRDRDRTPLPGRFLPGLIEAPVELS